VVIGLLVASASGVFYLLSLLFVSEPERSVGVLLLGRGLLGIAESFIVTGSLTWGLSLMGPQNSGKVMAWVGTALYAALAIGAPSGTLLHASFGFAAIGLATMLIPLVTLPVVASSFTAAVAPPPQQSQASFAQVLGVVWLPGLGLGISGVGFGAITTFVVLLFAEHGWEHAWLAFTAMSVAFIAGRLIFGHLPDRIGGAKVALVCVLIESLGLALIWLAPWFWLALIGVTLSGLGYSLVYPGFGVEAIRRAPPENRGLAMGAYTAFLDLSLGGSGPLLGLIAGSAGLGAVFLVSTLVVLSSTVIAVCLLDSSDTAGVSASMIAEKVTDQSHVS
jgi:MFS family permease